MSKETRRTGLSAGIVVHYLLTNSEEVKAITDKIYPVVATSMTTPYIAFRCTAQQTNPSKARDGADVTTVEVQCMSADYIQSIDLAEAVRGALEYRQAETGGLVMRGCVLDDREELWADDTFIQRLIFKLRIY